MSRPRHLGAWERLTLWVCLAFLLALAALTGPLLRNAPDKPEGDDAEVTVRIEPAPPPEDRRPERDQADEARLFLL